MRENYKFERETRNFSSVARSAGLFRSPLALFLGFRFAPPQALCCHPLRGLFGGLGCPHYIFLPGIKRATPKALRPPAQRCAH